MTWTTLVRGSAASLAAVAALGVLLGCATHVLARCHFGCYHVRGVTWTDPNYPCWMASEYVCPPSATPTYGRDDPVGGPSTSCTTDDTHQVYIYRCTQGDPECTSRPSVAECDYYTCEYVRTQDATGCDTGT